MLIAASLAPPLAPCSADEKLARWQRPNSWVRLHHARDTRADALLIGCFPGLLFARGIMPQSHRFRRACRLGELTHVALAVGGLPLQVGVAPVHAQAAILEAPVMESTGRISHRLYLWHAPVAWIPASYQSDRWGPFSVFIARGALSVLAARWSDSLIGLPACAGGNGSGRFNLPA